MDSTDIARKYGYSIETWSRFASEPELPEGLLARARATRAELEARGEVVTHVLYDLEDDDEGFLILGTDPEAMCWELCDHGDIKEFDEIEVPERVMRRPNADLPSPPSP